jgi:hypothetical protein
MIREDKMAEAYGWDNVSTIESKDFTCGYCGRNLASNIGYFHRDGNMRIYICHFCWRPTYFGSNSQTPGVPYGEDIDSISEGNIQELYDEARKSYSCNAFTGAVLCCRKLLMNIAVSKGAKAGLQFVEYVEFLASKGYVPPDGNDWVDHIREKGNEATHEISIMKKEDAEDLITFIEMLLKFIYEFPEKVRKKKTK